MAVIDLAPITRSSPSPANDTALSHDSLDIPEFLRRTSLNTPSCAWRCRQEPSRRGRLRTHARSFAAEFLPTRPSVTLRFLKRKNLVWTGKSRRMVSSPITAFPILCCRSLAVARRPRSGCEAPRCKASVAGSVEEAAQGSAAKSRVRSERPARRKCENRVVPSISSHRREGSMR